MNLKNIFRKKKTQECEPIPVEELISEMIKGCGLAQLGRVKIAVEYEIEEATKREEERKKEIEEGGLPF